MTDAERLNETQYKLEAAVEEILALHRERTTLLARLENAVTAARDAEVVERFWKSAAERALRLWDRAQDEIDDTKTLARRAVRLAQCYIELAADLDDPKELEDDLEQCSIWFEQLEGECAPSS